ncbi:MAG: hypothetical protein M3179_10395 [Actinomycetota bacterium]|nr:hypothetical protein [Actinomycetota bacterium]
MTVIAAAAVGGLVYVASESETGGTGSVRPAEVETVTPEGGNLDLRQVTIAADLAPGYTGYLEIDGVEVPEDDLQRVAALNQIILRPGPDSDYVELDPGSHCATVVYRRIGQPQEQPRSYRWCFVLH